MTRKDKYANTDPIDLIAMGEVEGWLKASEATSSLDREDLSNADGARISANFIARGAVNNKQRGRS